MSKEEVKRCKYDEDSVCAFSETFGKDEPDLVECLLCSGAGYAQIAVTFMGILSAVGAKQFGKEFLISVVELDRAQKLRLAILEKERPEHLEVLKKRGGRQGIMVLTPEDLPEGLRQAFENYKKRGDRMRI